MSDSLFTLLDTPELASCQTSYHRRDWGFCLSRGPRAIARLSSPMPQLGKLTQVARVKELFLLLQGQICFGQEWHENTVDWP